MTIQLRAKVQSPDRLVSAMRFRGLTNRGLASRVGVSQALIGHLRRGYRTTTTYLDAVAIAEALDMPIDYLFVPELARDSQAERRAS